MSNVRAAFWSKNVPTWERVLRLFIAGSTLVLAVLFLPTPWNLVASASAAGFALTGLVGFCPMCAFVGRKLK